MTEEEIIYTVKEVFGDLVQSVERQKDGEHIIVIRKDPICALAIDVNDALPDFLIRSRVINARDTFANGLEKLIAAGGDYKKAWANG